MCFCLRVLYESKLNIVVYSVSIYVAAVIVCWSPKLAYLFIRVWRGVTLPALINQNRAMGKAALLGSDSQLNQSSGQRSSQAETCTLKAPKCGYRCCASVCKFKYFRHLIGYVRKTLPLFGSEQTKVSSSQSPGLVPTTLCRA